MKQKENIMKTRDYQETIIKAQSKFMTNNDLQRGQVYSPTGSGKNVCIDALVSEMTEGNSGKKICIVYPALAMDKQTRLKDKSNVEFTSFQDGVEELQHVLDATKMNHITTTTYQTFPLIANMKFDLIICYEAQNMVQRDCAEVLSLIKSKVLFYTATPITKIDGITSVVSMNNKKLFGEPICDIKPVELIDKGYIVPPSLVELKVATDEYGMAVSPYLTVAHAVADLKARLTKVNNKLLVSMTDTTYFDDFQDNISEMETYTGDIDLYTIAEGEQVKNGKKLKSQEHALKDIAENEKQCVIVYCDTLGEGIDVPGITATFLMLDYHVHMSKPQLVKTVERVARPSQEDMNENGEVIDMNNRVKPSCYVYILKNYEVNTICEAFIEGGYGDSVKVNVDFNTNESSYSSVQL